MAYDYDLLVIGSGPAGQRAAIQASKLGKKTAIIEKRAVIGGVCTNTGTIPSKTLREAVMHLSGYRERTIYGSAYSVKENISMADLAPAIPRRPRPARSHRGQDHHRHRHLGHPRREHRLRRGTSSSATTSSGSIAFPRRWRSSAAASSASSTPASSRRWAPE
ncbi:MAG TPA: FAD-dependent oxidoreductase [Myxococcales bacterium]|nr:FAD-dependent oxidoreductase [Myxococcales bacterium]